MCQSRFGRQTSREIRPILRAGAMPRTGHGNLRLRESAMTGLGFALFDTGIGRCGVVWGANGLRCVQLPETSPAATRARLLKRFPDATESPAPAVVQRAI